MEKIKKNITKCYKCKHYFDSINAQTIIKTDEHDEDTDVHFCPEHRVNYGFIKTWRGHESYYKEIEVDKNGIVYEIKHLRRELEEEKSSKESLSGTIIVLSVAILIGGFIGYWIGVF